MAKKGRREGTDTPYLSEEEEGAVADHRSLSSVAVYEVVSAEGRDELARPIRSLWWSGVAAGICISASVLAEGILHVTFEGNAYRTAIENFGYTVGFVLVILSRLQLFTENTVTVVLPVLKDRSWTTLVCAARLWSIVLAANLIGTFFTAVLTIHAGTITPEHQEGMMAISHHFAEYTAWEAFIYGIPAGFFIAAIVWMLPSSQGYEIFVILLFTYLIAIGEFTHVVAGSTEAFILLVSGDVSLGKAFLGLIAPTLAGNIVGGTGLFALLAWGQVKAEVENEERGS